MPHLLLFFSRYFDKYATNYYQIREGIVSATNVVGAMKKMIKCFHLGLLLDETMECFGNLEWVEGLIEIIRVLFKIEIMYTKENFSFFDDLIFLLSALFESRIDIYNRVAYNVRIFLEKYSNVYPEIIYYLYIYHHTNDAQKIIDRTISLARNIDKKVSQKLTECKQYI